MRSDESSGTPVRHLPGVVVRPFVSPFAAPGLSRGRPAAPRWADRTVVEDGGVTHELVSDVHPVALGDRTGPVPEDHPTDLSVSVFDRPTAHGWRRDAPTIQIEGGSFSLDEARRLVTAVTDLITLAADHTRAGPDG